MEDVLKFLAILAIVIIGIIKEANKGKSKKAPTQSPTPAQPFPMDPTPQTSSPVPTTTLPENWGIPTSIEEIFNQKPARQQTAKRAAKQTSKPKKRKEEVSIAASLAKIAEQEGQRSTQELKDMTYNDSVYNNNFEIHSAEEARRAIILGEILQRKY